MLLRFAMLGLFALLWALPLSAQTSTPAEQAPATPSNAANAGGTATESKPETSSEMRPLRVGKDVTPPKVIYDPDPKFSDAARRAKYQGTVVLWLVVTVDGSTARIRVAKSVGMGLDEAAVAAVQTWRFQPSTRNGEPVPVQINVEVNFRLHGSPQIYEVTAPLVPKAGEPRFQGVDLAQYPLVVHVGTATGVPAGKSYEIVASAAVVEASGSHPLSISCSGKKNDCLFPGAGDYPGRWLSPNHQLEILGRARNSWEKTQYSVK